MPRQSPQNHDEGSQKRKQNANVCDSKNFAGALKFQALMTASARTGTDLYAWLFGSGPNVFRINAVHFDKPDFGRHHTCVKVQRMDHGSGEKEDRLETVAVFCANGPLWPTRKLRRKAG